MPGPLIGLTYFQIFDCDWGPAINRILDRTILLPVLATMTYGWPIVAILCWHLVHEVPSELLDAAEMDGVPRWRQLWTLFVRGAWRQLLGVAILLFAWMFGELSASQMVLPAGVDTVPRLMLGFLHAGVDEMTAAFGLILIVGWFLVAGFGQLFIRLNSLRRLT
jgi:ABC-type Fe3+ transport system permease subunit